MRATILASLSSAAVIVGAGTAMAGGVVAPVVEAAPIQVAPAPVMGAWQGAYAGGSLGYILGTDDQLGLAFLDGGEQTERRTNLGDVGVSGASLGAHVGYRWQRDRWVFGPELGFELNSADESISYTVDGVPGTAKSELNNSVTLVMKTGYAVDPQTLVYGTFGVARGDFDYTITGPLGSLTEGFTATGVAAGLGVERMVNDRVSVFAEYQYRDYGNETLTFTDPIEPELQASTRASMSMSSIKIGANFKF